MNRFVLADPGRCIGCYACVAGCVESHRAAGLQAYPRLYIMHAPGGAMPVQCRHCEYPSCMAVCPVQAISLRHDSIVLNETLCIGCKLCALACPFGAIIPGGTPLPAQEFNGGQYSYLNTPYQVDPMYLRQFALSRDLSLLDWSIGRRTLAVKCDLCYFRQEGPACVSACPHNALRLVDEPGDESSSFIEATKKAAVPSGTA